MGKKEKGETAAVKALRSTVARRMRGARVRHHGTELARWPTAQTTTYDVCRDMPGD